MRYCDLAEKIRFDL